MGNKLDLNVDRKLRIPLLALSAGSVMKESIEHWPASLSCSPEGRYCSYLTLAPRSGKREDNWKDKDNDIRRLCHSATKVVFVLEDPLLRRDLREILKGSRNLYHIVALFP